jgi:hypothetical protein
MSVKEESVEPSQTQSALQLNHSHEIQQHHKMQRQVLLQHAHDTLQHHRQQVAQNQHLHDQHHHQQATILRTASRHLYQKPHDSDVFDIALTLASVRDSHMETESAQHNQQVTATPVAEARPEELWYSDVESANLAPVLAGTQSIAALSLLNRRNNGTAASLPPHTILTQLVQSPLSHRLKYMQVDVIDHGLELFLTSPSTSLEQLYLYNIDFRQQDPSTTMATMNYSKIFSLLWSLQCSQSTTLLSLIECQFDAWSLQKLIQGLPKISIVDLRFDSCKGEFTGENLKNLLQCGKITSLALEGMSPSIDENIDQVALGLRSDASQTLQSLRISSNSIAALAQAVVVPTMQHKLQTLHLCGAVVDQGATACLASLLANPKCLLHNLGFRDCMFSEGSLDTIFQIFQRSPQINTCYVQPLQNQESVFWQRFLYNIGGGTSIKHFAAELWNPLNLCLQQQIIDCLERNSVLESFELSKRQDNDWDRLVFVNTANQTTTKPFIAPEFQGKIEFYCKRNQIQRRSASMSLDETIRRLVSYGPVQEGFSLLFVLLQYKASQLFSSS